MRRSRSCCCRRRSRCCSWARNGRARGRSCSSAISSRSWPRRCGRVGGASSRNSPSSARRRRRTASPTRRPRPASTRRASTGRSATASRTRTWLERYRRLLAVRAREIVPRLRRHRRRAARFVCSGRRRCAWSGASATARAACCSPISPSEDVPLRRPAARGRHACCIARAEPPRGDRFAAACAAFYLLPSGSGGAMSRRRAAPCRRPARHRDAPCRCPRRRARTGRRNTVPADRRASACRTIRNRPPRRSTRNATRRRSASPRCISWTRKTRARRCLCRCRRGAKRRVALPARGRQRAGRAQRRRRVAPAERACRSGYHRLAVAAGRHDSRDRPDRRAAHRAICRRRCSRGRAAGG